MQTSGAEVNGEVLIIDDDQAMCELVSDALSRHGYRTAWETSAERGYQSLQERDFDVVLTDLSMEGMHGLELCERVTASHPDLPVVVITAYGSLETAVGAIRAGAYDFITKPVDTDVLALAVQRAARQSTLTREIKRLRSAAAEPARPLDMIGESPAMRQVADLVSRVAQSDVSVLVTGESGTGKELVARAIHAQSSRCDHAFVPVNCAAVPEGLLESELFGHAKGAFTDARGARGGLFMKAHQGTLFLDEIGDLAAGTQAKLLRALQERRVRPVGGDSEIEFDARLISATNRDIDTEVAERRFRKDLFYRINVVRVDVPPLRARGNDVLLLAHHFLQRAAERTGREIRGLVSAAAEKLTSYDFPGNVRELENCMERAVALARFDQIGVEDLPRSIRDYHPSAVFVPSANPSELLPMQEVERRYIQQVLKAVGGNKTRAAAVLGFDRRTLYRKLSRYGLS